MTVIVSFLIECSVNQKRYFLSNGLKIRLPSKEPVIDQIAIYTYPFAFISGCFFGQKCLNNEQITPFGCQIKRCCTVLHDDK